MTKTKIGYWGFIFIIITIFTVYAVNNITGQDGFVALASTISDDPRLAPSEAFLFIGNVDSGDNIVSSTQSIDEDGTLDLLRSRFDISEQSSVVCALTATQRDTLTSMFDVTVSEFPIDDTMVDMISVDGGGLSHLELSEALREVLGVRLDCTTVEVGSIPFLLYNAHLS